MLIAEEKSRTKLQVVKYGSCSTEELRCLGSGRIYIRPIQVNIALADIEDLDDESEECLLCKISIPLASMRGHMESCPVCDVFVDTVYAELNIKFCFCF